VAFRNANLLAVAVSWAEVIGAEAVFIGAVWEDSSGYPDCRPEFYRAFNEAVRAGTKPETRIEVLTPVIGMRKSEIVRRGIELGAPLHLTHSCYVREDEACGACGSCVLRRRAFAEAGERDPAPCRTRVEQASG
jgi:7-cyano-7-deazaguanine synthase